MTKVTKKEIGGGGGGGESAILNQKECQIAQIFTIFIPHTI